LDRSGVPLPFVENSLFGNLDVAPHGRLAAVSAQPGLLLLDEKGLATPLNERGASPVFSPGGSTLIVSRRADPANAFNLFRVSLQGAHAPEQITQSSDGLFASDWSRDGERILYSLAKTDCDMWSLSVEAQGNPVGEPQLYLATPGMECWGVFSPERNPQWVAYQSDALGRLEIYVNSYPNPGRPIRISDDGGAYPKWNSDGLYYVSLDDKLVFVTLNTGNGTVEVRTREVLFPMRTGDSGLTAPTYEVYPGGKQFLVNTVEGNSRTLNLLDNWTGPLKEK
jgi:hypothetical protein